MRYYADVISNALKKNTIGENVICHRGVNDAVYIESVSKFPKQRERLFDKDCIYRVLSKSKDLVELKVI